MKKVKRVRRESILMIWIAGLVLAVLLYLIGPDRFFDAIFNIVDTIDAAARNLVAVLGAQAYGAVRALAIAIYIVFVVLSVLASQRGHRGFFALLVVTGLCMVLVWRPFGIYPAPLGRWLLALVLVVVGALAMTRRLLTPPVRPLGPPPPFPPGGRP